MAAFSSFQDAGLAIEPETVFGTGPVKSSPVLVLSEETSKKLGVPKKGLSALSEVISFSRES